MKTIITSVVAVMALASVWIINPAASKSTNKIITPSTIIANGDLALQFTTIAGTGIPYGSDIPFDLVINNNSTVTVNNIDLEVEIPAGFSFVTPSGFINQGWSVAGTTATKTITSSILPSSSSSSEVLTLELGPSPLDTSGWTVNAIITGADDVTNTEALTDTNPNNDSGIARVDVTDFAIKKTLETLPPYNWGQNLTFRIDVYNQGNTTPDAIEIVEYVNEGFIYDDGINPGWSVSVAAPTFTFGNPFFPGLGIEAGDSSFINIDLELRQLKTDLTAWDNSAEISNVFLNFGNLIDSDSSPGSNNPIEIGVRPGDPDDDDIFNIDGSTDPSGLLTLQDDHDVAGPMIYDLAIRKITASNLEFYTYTQRVIFDIEIFNAGNVAATNLEITDYLPCGLNFSNIPANAGWNFIPGPGLGKVKRSIPGTLKADSTVVVQISLDVDPCFDSEDPTRWLNIAEISTATPVGVPPGTLDIDSTPDDINNDVNTSNPDANDISGDGKQGGDEDDHEPELTAIFDAALKKIIVTPTPYTYGQDITFRIIVYNQGSVPIDQITIQDTLGAGYEYQTTINNSIGWNGNINQLRYTFPNSFPPGSSDSVEIVTRIIPAGNSPDNWYNYAWLQTTMRNGLSVITDADSDIQKVYPGEFAVTPGSPEDDDIFALPPVGPQGNYLFDNDQDKHDVAGFNVFDLALVKTLVGPSPTLYNDDVNYKIKVYNQGNLTAENIVVRDTIPEGLEYNLSNNGTWAYNPATRIATATISGPVLPLAADSISISLKLKSTIGGNDDWTNIAELGSAYNTDSMKAGIDFDSNFDDDFSNDVGGTPDTNEDDHIDDNGFDWNMDGIFDEDDHDPHKMRVVDLALRKSVVSSAPYAVGTDVTFKIVVYNQGNVPVFNVIVRDYQAPGYAISGNNIGWSTVLGNYERSIPFIAPGQADSVEINLTVLSAGTDVTDYYNFAEVASALDDPQGQDVSGEDLDSNPGSNTPTERSIVPGDANDDIITNHDIGGIEDDFDVAGTTRFDLAIDKSLISTPPFRYNELLTYKIKVTNEGTQSANDISVVDYIPCGLVYDTSSDNPWNLGLDGYARAMIAGPIAPGASDSINIFLRTEPCLIVTDRPWLNAVEIYDAFCGQINKDVDDDSVYDENPNDDPEDDSYDEEPTPIIDIALIKTNNISGPLIYNSPITFTFKIVNQGNVPFSSIQIEDYLPSGFSFNPATGNNANWNNSGPNPTYEFTKQLDRLEMDSTDIILTVLETSGGRGIYYNFGEVITLTDLADEEIQNGEADSEAGSDTDEERSVVLGGPDDDNFLSRGIDFDEDQDDHDVSGDDLFDLELEKSIPIPSAPYTYGEEVEYLITVRNTGSLAATSFEITDFVPCGLEFVPGNGWAYTSGDRKAKKTINSTLEPGDSTTEVITLMVMPCDGDKSTAWVNNAEISIAIDENGDSDDQDSDFNDTLKDEPTTNDHVDDEPIDIIDLALIKVATNIGSGPLSNNDPVSFGFTIFNQGNVPITRLVLADYLGAGFTFYESDNQGWVINSGEISLDTITNIPPGTNKTFEIIVRIGASGDPGAYLNYGEVLAVFSGEEDLTGSDADSQPGSDTPEEQSIMPGDPEDDDETTLGLFFDEDQDDHDVAEREAPVGTIAGVVWKDLNNNGLRDFNEPPINGVTVILKDCQGNTIETLSTQSPDGDYLFEDVFAGSYFVTILNPDPANCLYTEQDAMNNDLLDSDVADNGETECFNLSAGEDKTNVDGGFIPLLDLGDYVWLDENGNGIQDQGEPGIVDVKVRLFSTTTGFIGEETTNNSGFYEFTGILPDEYYMELIFADELVSTLANQGGNDAVDSDLTNDNGPNTSSDFNLAFGAPTNIYDYGLFRCIDICGTIWYDYDLDSYEDPIENGINGIEIQLYRLNNGVPRLYGSTTTGLKPGTPSDDGYYNFCVPPGEYYIEVKLPLNGLVRAKPNFVPNEARDSDITDRFGPHTSDKIIVNSNANTFFLCQIDGGYYPMATIGDMVWIDNNGDGLRSDDEPMAEGVRVEAYNLDNEIVAETISDQNGLYRLEYLKEDDHYLKFYALEGFGFTFTDINQNGVEAINSDVDHTRGPNTTKIYTTVPDEHIPHIDAGLLYSSLPVSWIDFSGKHQDGKNYLKWSTALEVNTDVFEVMRRAPREIGFSKIGEVVASGNSNKTNEYNFTDNEVKSNGNYIYRLRQLDLNGESNFSKMINISVDNAYAGAVAIYPNPATNVINLRNAAKIKSIKVIDALGKVVLNIQENNITDRISLNGKLASGNYLFQIQTIDNEVIYKKIIILSK